MEDPLYQWFDIRLSKEEAGEREGAGEGEGTSGPPDVEELLRDAIRADRCLELLDHAWAAAPSSQGSEESGIDGGSGASLSESMDKLGRFTIKRLIGYGGMGVVFLANDPVVGRDVALKIPHSGMLVTEQAKARFLREAQVAGILRHPNIVRVFETGEAQGIFFIASEYWEGPTLAKWIEDFGGEVVEVDEARAQRATRTWGISSRQAVRICVSLAEALQHAHDRDAIHRDLKPSNILLTEEQISSHPDSAHPDSAHPDSAHPDTGNGGVGHSGRLFAPSMEDSGTVRWQPRITDFGLARSNNTDLSLTMSGTTLGTAEYMPPEQAMGDQSEVGPAADQYALGIILYQLLTGVSPYRRDSLAKTLIASQQDAPPDLREFRPDLSKDLEAICLKAIAKEPQQRYPSAGELADDLQRYLDNKPIVARPISAAGRLQRWSRRNPGLALVTSGLIAAIIMVVVVVTRSNLLLSEANLDLEESLKHANQLQRQADESRRVAERQAKLAAEREIGARRVAYLSDMKLAARAAVEDRWIEVSKLLQRHVPQTGITDVRKLEWRVLNRQVRQRIERSAKHPGAVNEITLFPQGDRVATACEDGCIRIWRLQSDGEDWQPERVIQALQVGLHAVAVSPDGKTVAAAGPSWMPGNTSVTLWDVQTGEPRQTLHRHATTIEDIQFSPDGNRIASAARNDCCRVWDLALNRSIKIDGTKEWICDLAFASDDQIVSIVEGKLLARFDAATGDVVRSRERARLSTVWKHQQVVVCSYSDQLWFFDVKSFKRIGRLPVDGNVVRRISASESGVLAVALRDGNVQCWQMSREQDKVSCQLLSDQYVHRGEVRDVEVVSDDRVVSASVDGTHVVSRYRLDPSVRGLAQEQDPSPHHLQPNQPNGVIDAILFDRGQRMISLDMHGRVVHHVFAPSDDATIQVIAHNSTPATCLAISHNERYATAGFENGEVLLFDLHNPELEPFRLNTLNHEMYFMPVVCAVGDDAVVYTSNVAYKVGVWDVKRRQRLKTLPLGSVCRDLALTRDNRLLICGQDDIQIFSTTDYALVKRFSGSNIVEALDVSPDGRQFVSAHEDGGCRIWDLDSLELKHMLPAQSTEASDVHYADAGARILSCTEQGIRIWDADSGDALGAFPPHAGWKRISYSGDRMIVVAGDDGLRSTTRWLPIALNDATLPVIGHPPAGEDVRAYSYSSLVKRRLALDGGVGFIKYADDQHVWVSGGRRTLLWNFETGETAKETLTPPIIWMESGPSPHWLAMTNMRASLLPPELSEVRWSKTTEKPTNWEGGTVTAAGTVFLTDSAGRLTAFDAASGEEQWSIRRPESGRTCIPWGDQMIVWGGTFPYMAIHDVSSGRKMHHAYSVCRATSLACNENRLVSGHSDGMIRVWQLVDGRLRLLHALAGHPSIVNSLHVEGDVLISASQDKVIVWDVGATKARMTIQPAASQRFRSATLSADGLHAVIAYDGKGFGVGWIELPRLDE